MIEQERTAALALAVWLGLGLTASPARAQEEEPPPGEDAAAVLEIEPEKERLECPKEQPALLIKAPHDGQMELKLGPAGAGGAEQVFRAALKAGKPFRQGWTQTAAEATYTAQLHIDYDAGKTFDGTMGFTFYCAPRIDVRLAQGGIDLAHGRLRLVVSGPAVRAESTVATDDGGVLAQETIKLAGGEGKKPLALKWPVDERGFGGLVLKLFDKHDAWVKLELTPFSLEIPHEDVEFENGKWDIRPSEEHKLQDTLAQIRAELARFTDDLTEPSLYIVGYTDTVGSRADNLKLSNNRARSIGRWFREHGLGGPIFYQGFGEDILAVETPDETPEPANRRASYILTNFPPPIQPAVPRANWQKL